MKENCRIELCRLTPMDVVVVSIIVLAAVAAMWHSGSGRGRLSANAVKATVSVDGRVLAPIDLLRDREITLLDGKMIVEIKNRRLRVKESECPRRICVQTGWIGREGEVIICIPFKTIIRIGNPGAPALDAVVF